MEKKMGRYLTGADMMTGSGCKSKIVVYPDLYKYKNIDDLLAPHGVVFLLYEYEPNTGHWTMVFRQGDTIEHFDSYSFKPDREFEFISDDFRKENKMNYPQLTKLLYDSGQDIHYNNFSLQAENRGVATCGRHCLVRLRFKDMNIYEYYELMKFLTKKTGYSVDELVTILTE